ncbi:hypothetical protein D8674_021499 [Pyrus ussuriensis x Pyrus communis]|uniref:Uncharacterized protein n=1 Tax=Pyrus ussuriensis x Pyrus communis TaxID=2448454 RepID=A0A5N5GM13_9ROSA|nr:hypothetical protein D8674_021499 [Pyrus ussuriensis x Pyrus communis]
MLHLIRTPRVMSSTPSPTATPSPTTTPIIAATAPAEMDHRLVNPVDPVGPLIPEVQASSTSSVALLQHSALAHNIGHVVRTFCPMRWKSWKAIPKETKNTMSSQLSISNTNYNLEDMDDDMFVYLNRLFSERYKQWKSDLHQCFQQFDDPQVAFEEGWPKELEDRQHN